MLLYLEYKYHSATIFSGSSSLNMYSFWWSRKYSLDRFTSMNMLYALRMSTKSTSLDFRLAAKRELVVINWIAYLRVVSTPIWVRNSKASSVSSTSYYSHLVSMICFISSGV